MYCKWRKYCGCSCKLEVLIVAKCIVNEERERMIKAKYFVLIVAKCIVNDEECYGIKYGVMY